MRRFIRHNFLIFAGLLYLAGLSAPAFGLEESLTVSGRVIDADGDARGGAVVHLLPRLNEYESARRSLVDEPAPRAAASVRSRRDGRFRLTAPEPGLWRVIVRTDDHPAMEYRLAPLLDTLELPTLKLGGADRLEVRLRDVDGNPRPGRVVAYPQPAVIETTVIEPGMATWRAVPRVAHAGDDGVAHLMRRHQEELWIAGVVSGSVRAVTKVEAGRRSLDLLWVGTQAVRLRTTDSRHRPLTGTLVWLDGYPLPLAMADDEGQLTLGLSSRSGLIKLLAPTGHSLTYPFEAIHHEATAGALTESVVELQLDPPMEISGRVLTLDRREPVPGAWIWTDVVGGSGNWWTVSEGSGRFVLMAPAIRRRKMLAVAPGYRLAREVRDMSTWDPATGLTFVLPPAAGVKGRIVDATGRPLTGVAVHAKLTELGGSSSVVADPRSTAPQPWRANSSSEGHYQLSGLIPDAGYELVFAKRGFAPTRLRLDALRAFEVRSLEVTLDAGRMAYGQIVGPEDMPVAGARVRLVRPREVGQVLTRHRRLRAPAEVLGQTTSGSTGQFALSDIGPGRFDLEVQARGFAPARIPGLVVTKSEEGDAEEAFDFGVVVLVTGGMVQGAVMDPDGNPVDGAEVLARRPGGLSPELAVEQRVVSGVEGLFQFVDLRTGERWNLTITAPGFGAAHTNATAALNGESLMVVLEPAARLAGRVMDAKGGAIEGARVTLKEVVGGLAQPAVTDADGRFQLPEVTPGAVELEARATGFQTARLSGLEVAAGGELDDLELVLRPGAGVHGIVTDPEGEPVAGARVRLSSVREGAALPEAQVLDVTDGDGRYRLDGVPPGAASIAAHHGEYQQVTQRLTLTLGSQVVDLAFAGGFQVAGRVEDRDGLPVSGASISLESLDGFVPEESSAADGSFAFRNVPVGRYQLTATGEGRAPARLPVVVNAGDATGLRLQLGQGTRLHGQIIGVEFDELATLTVHAFGETGDVRRGQVDYDRRYVISGLEPGRWTVRAEVAGSGRSASDSVRIEASASEAQRDLELTAGYTLTGGVYDRGQALGGVRVAVAGDRQQGSALTDSSGRFQIDHLPAGDYLLTLTTASGLRQEEALELVSDEDLYIELATARVIGVVRDDLDERPLAGVTVALERDVSFSGATMGGQASAAATSDSQGRFYLEGLQEGAWRLAAHRSGYANEELTFEVQAGDPVELELRLKPTEGLSFEAVHESGHSVRHVVLAIHDSAGWTVASGQYQAQEAGVFRVSTVPAGSWEMVIRSPSSATVRRPVTAPGHLGRITLPAGGSLHLTVAELQGATDAAQVRLIDPSGRPYSAPPAAETWTMFGGRATIDHLSAGTWNFTISHPDGRGWSGSATVAAGTATPVTLE